MGKVLIHAEGGFHGTVSHQLHLDLLHIFLDGVNLLAVRFVLMELLCKNISSYDKVKLYLLIGHFIARIVAGRLTVRCWGKMFGTILSGPIDMMLTRLDLIGLTSLPTPVLTSTHQAALSPELPGSPRVTCQAILIAAWSILIGRGMSRLGSHWSRGS